MATITAINDVKELPDTVGKMRTIGIANDVQRFLHRAEKALKHAKALNTFDAINVINYSLSRMELDTLVLMPDTGGLSLPCFNELCKNPTEDGLQGLIDSLKQDVIKLYEMADVPGME